MDKMVQKGYILLADISGFDAYITKVELDHAKGVVKELLELIIDGLTPPMELASLEGDAVLAYASEKKLAQGELILEIIETTYADFRDHLNSIQRNNSCDCMACREALSLDLKFLLHFGEYSVQSGEGGGIELGGLDANLVRERLLKDQVRHPNGNDAYILFTAQSLDRLGMVPGGMEQNCNSYPHLGEIKTARFDLRSWYEEFIETRPISVSEEEATFVLTYDFSKPPDMLWSWLNDPVKRSHWTRWRSWSSGKRPWGRIGIGAENHCAHGLGSIKETIVDWNPYSSFTVRSQQESIHFSMLQTYKLEEASEDEGTRLHILTILQNKGPFGLTRKFLRKGLARLWLKDLQRLEQLMKEEELQLGPRLSVI
jgi:hypothetical protein